MSLDITNNATPTIIRINNRDLRAGQVLKISVDGHEMEIKLGKTYRIDQVCKTFNRWLKGVTDKDITVTV